MAHFVWRVGHGVHDGENATDFFCLVELAESPGGEPVEFILYRRVMPHWMQGRPVKGRTEMIRLQAKNAEEAIRRFWPQNGTGKEFPGFKSTLWKPVHWLKCRGAICDKCTQFLSGVWTEVRNPPWIQFGNLPLILLEQKMHLRQLYEEDLKRAETLEELQKVQREMKATRSIINLVKKEMRHKRRRAKGAREKQEILTLC